MSWDDVSDDAIDFAVFIELCNGAPEEWSAKRVWNTLPEKPSYTRSWANIGSLIERDKIDLKYEETDDYEWFAGKSSGDDQFYEPWCSHSNPLRAAAIVYLMMNGVKPEDCK